MRAFELHEAHSLAEAVELLGAHGNRAQPLAGGTDLVAGVMRDQIVGKSLPYPEHLVDVTTVPELSGIRVGPEGAVVGAATTLVDIAESAEIAESWPLLAQAAGGVASPEIRSLGTLGGNVHQRPRCWFFRNRDFDCAKKGGDVCYAVKGDNRYNAIVGGNLCYIVHPSDLACALLVLEARARLVSAGGERIVPFDEYFVGPDEDLLRETVVRPGEILAEVVVPPAAHGRQVWRKVNEKGLPTWDFAVVSVAVALTAADGVWQDGRIVIGGIAPVPYRARVVEEALAGEDIRAALPAAAARLRDVARPMSRNAYKVELAEFVVREVVLAALEQEPAPAPALAAV